MLDAVGPSHSGLSFRLDVADKLIKFAAVCLGGVWTWWNFRKSRTYAQKLELQIAGHVFEQGDFYVDVLVTLRNVGASRYDLEAAGNTCEISVIFEDLSEQSLRVFYVFELSDSVEPGAVVSDQLQWRIPFPEEALVWVKIRLRVASNKIEWNESRLFRVKTDEKTGTGELQ